MPKMSRASSLRLKAVAVAGCAFVALSLFGAAQTPLAGASQQEESAEITWSTELDCTESCHTRVVASLTDEETQISASHGAFACTMCHTDVEGMTEGHEGVTAEDIKGPKRLKKSDVTSDGCLTCHAVTDGVVSEGAWALAEGEADEASEAVVEADTEAQVEDATSKPEASEEAEETETKAPAIPAYSASATADVTWLTDENGTTVNPHDLPVNKSHDTVTCATCHSMHDDATLEETAVKACKQCHHDNIYECFTCHD